MEIAQLGKSTCNIQLQQTIHLCDIAVENFLAEPRSRYDVAHLYPRTSVPTKYHLSIP